MKTVKVTIKSGINIKKEFKIKYGSFDMFQTEILKRFGNIQGTNTANRNREKAKDIIRQAHDFKDIENEVWRTGWEIEIWGE